MSNLSSSNSKLKATHPRLTPSHPPSASKRKTHPQEAGSDVDTGLWSASSTDHSIDAFGQGEVLLKTVNILEKHDSLRPGCEEELWSDLLPLATPAQAKVNEAHQGRRYSYAKYSNTNVTNTDDMTGTLELHGSDMHEDSWYCRNMYFQSPENIYDLSSDKMISAAKNNIHSNNATDNKAIRFISVYTDTNQPALWRLSSGAPLPNQSNPRTDEMNVKISTASQFQGLYSYDETSVGGLNHHTKYFLDRPYCTNEEVGYPTGMFSAYTGTLEYHDPGYISCGPNLGDYTGTLEYHGIRCSSSYLDVNNSGLDINGNSNSDGYIEKEGYAFDEVSVNQKSSMSVDKINGNKQSTSHAHATHSRMTCSDHLSPSKLASSTLPNLEIPVGKQEAGSDVDSGLWSVSTTDNSISTLCFSEGDVFLKTVGGRQKFDLLVPGCDIEVLSDTYPSNSYSNENRERLKGGQGWRRYSYTKPPSCDTKVDEMTGTLELHGSDIHEASWYLRNVYYSRLESIQLDSILKKTTISSNVQEPCGKTNESNTSGILSELLSVATISPNVQKSNESKTSGIISELVSVICGSKLSTQSMPNFTGTLEYHGPMYVIHGSSLGEYTGTLENHNIIVTSRACNSKYSSLEGRNNGLNLNGNSNTGETFGKEGDITEKNVPKKHATSHATHSRLTCSSPRTASKRASTRWPNLQSPIGRHEAGSDVDNGLWSASSTDHSKSVLGEGEALPSHVDKTVDGRDIQLGFLLSGCENDALSEMTGALELHESDMHEDGRFLREPPGITDAIQTDAMFSKYTGTLEYHAPRYEMYATDIDNNTGSLEHHDVPPLTGGGNSTPGGGHTIAGYKKACKRYSYIKSIVYETKVDDMTGTLELHGSDMHEVRWYFRNLYQSRPKNVVDPVLEMKTKPPNIERHRETSTERKTNGFVSELVNVFCGSKATSQTQNYTQMISNFTGTLEYHEPRHVIHGSSLSEYIGTLEKHDITVRSKVGGLRYYSFERPNTCLDLNGNSNGNEGGGLNELSITQKNSVMAGQNMTYQHATSHATHSRLTCSNPLSASTTRPNAQSQGFGSDVDSGLWSTSSTDHSKNTLCLGEGEVFSKIAEQLDVFVPLGRDMEFESEMTGTRELHRSDMPEDGWFLNEKHISKPGRGREFESEMTETRELADMPEDEWFLREKHFSKPENRLDPVRHVIAPVTSNSESTQEKGAFGHIMFSKYTGTLEYHPQRYYAIHGSDISNFTGTLECHYIPFVFDECHSFGDDNVLNLNGNSNAERSIGNEGYRYDDVSAAMRKSLVNLASRHASHSRMTCSVNMNAPRLASAGHPNVQEVGSDVDTGLWSASKSTLYLGEGQVLPKTVGGLEQLDVLGPGCDEEVQVLDKNPEVIVDKTATCNRVFAGTDITQYDNVFGISTDSQFEDMHAQDGQYTLVCSLFYLVHGNTTYCLNTSEPVQEEGNNAVPDLNENSANSHTHKTSSISICPSNSNYFSNTLSDKGSSVDGSLSVGSDVDTGLWSASSTGVSNGKLYFIGQEAYVKEVRKNDILDSSVILCDISKKGKYFRNKDHENDKASVEHKIPLLENTTLPKEESLLGGHPTLVGVHNVGQRSMNKTEDTAETDTISQDEYMFLPDASHLNGWGEASRGILPLAPSSEHKHVSTHPYGAVSGDYCKEANPILPSRIPPRFTTLRLTTRKRVNSAPSLHGHDTNNNSSPNNDSGIPPKLNYRSSGNMSTCGNKIFATSVLKPSSATQIANSDSDKEPKAPHGESIMLDWSRYIPDFPRRHKASPGSSRQLVSGAPTESKMGDTISDIDSMETQVGSSRDINFDDFPDNDDNDGADNDDDNEENVVKDVAPRQQPTEAVSYREQLVDRRVTYTECWQRVVERECLRRMKEELEMEPESVIAGGTAMKEATCKVDTTCDRDGEVQGHDNDKAQSSGKSVYRSDGGSQRCDQSQGETSSCSKLIVETKLNGRNDGNHTQNCNNNGTTSSKHDNDHVPIRNFHTGYSTPYTSKNRSSRTCRSSMVRINIPRLPTFNGDDKQAHSTYEKGTGRAKSWTRLVGGMVSIFRGFKKPSSNSSLRNDSSDIDRINDPFHNNTLNRKTYRGYNTRSPPAKPKSWNIDEASYAHPFLKKILQEETIHPPNLSFPKETPSTPPFIQKIREGHTRQPKEVIECDYHSTSPPRAKAIRASLEKEKLEQSLRNTSRDTPNTKEKLESSLKVISSVGCGGSQLQKSPRQNNQDDNHIIIPEVTVKSGINEAKSPKTIDGQLSSPCKSKEPVYLSVQDKTSSPYPTSSQMNNTIKHSADGKSSPLLTNQGFRKPSPTISDSPKERRGRSRYTKINRPKRDSKKTKKLGNPANQEHSIEFKTTNATRSNMVVGDENVDEQSIDAKNSYTTLENVVNAHQLPNDTFMSNYIHDSYKSSTFPEKPVVFRTVNRMPVRINRHFPLRMIVPDLDDMASGHEQKRRLVLETPKPGLFVSTVFTSSDTLNTEETPRPYHLVSEKNRIHLNESPHYGQGDEPRRLTLEPEYLVSHTPGDSNSLVLDNGNVRVTSTKCSDNMSGAGREFLNISGNRDNVSNWRLNKISGTQEHILDISDEKQLPMWLDRNCLYVEGTKMFIGYDKREKSNPKTTELKDKSSFDVGYSAIGNKLTGIFSALTNKNDVKSSVKNITEGNKTIKRNTKRKSTTKNNVNMNKGNSSPVNKSNKSNILNRNRNDVKVQMKRRNMITSTTNPSNISNKANILDRNRSDAKIKVKRSNILTSTTQNDTSTNKNNSSTNIDNNIININAISNSNTNNSSRHSLHVHWDVVDEMTLNDVEQIPSEHYHVEHDADTSTLQANIQNDYGSRPSTNRCDRSRPRRLFPPHVNDASMKNAEQSELYSVEPCDLLQPMSRSVGCNVKVAMSHQAVQTGASIDGSLTRICEINRGAVDSNIIGSTFLPDHFTTQRKSADGDKFEKNKVLHGSDTTSGIQLIGIPKTCRKHTPYRKKKKRTRGPAVESQTGEVRCHL